MRLRNQLPRKYAKVKERIIMVTINMDKIITIIIIRISNKNNKQMVLKVIIIMLISHLFTTSKLMQTMAFIIKSSLL
jgi:hypothetical protein